MKRLLVAGAAILVGVSSSGPVESPPKPEVVAAGEYASAHFKPEDRLFLENTARAVSKVLGTHANLTLLEGDMRIPNQPFTKDTDPIYVEDGRLIVIGAQSLNGLLRDYTDRTERQEQAFLAFVDAHENGHDFQNERHISQEPPHDQTFFEQTDYRRTNELQADCLAGVAAKALFPKNIHDMEEVLMRFPVDPTHGTPTERASHFVSGATGGDC